MPWVEVFAVFVVCHLSGDYLLQTDWQALNKHGGLGSDPQARRALLSHIATYTLAFVPALVWLADELGPSVVGVGALIALPHLLQDDGRLLAEYMRKVKGLEPSDNPPAALAVDQSMHYLSLFLVALVAAA